MYASDNAASSAFHAAVSAPSPVPSPQPVSRVPLRLTLYHGKVLARPYVHTFMPRPDRMPGSLPPSPPASEPSETEQQPSQPRVSSARVTRSQTRAREEAGLPSLLVGSSTSTPVLNLSDVVGADEVDNQKQPRVTSSPAPEPMSDDSDDSSLFHPRRR
eukprot:3634951-Pleurochrysis_carterae.AAC.1